jgi:hypothetical protein
MNAIRPNSRFKKGEWPGSRRGNEAESPEGLTASLPRRLLWLISAFLLLTGMFGIAQTTNKAANAPSTADYSSFRIITDRDIFDPNRYPHSTARRETRIAPQVDSFSLAGTMIYQKGRFAFFDGTSTEYRKILEPGGVIAGYKVTEIMPGSVKMEAAGKPIELKVGARMRHEDDGTWQLIASEAELPAAPAESTEESATETDAPAGNDSSLEGNDVLKRLMQQREQEMK